MAEHRRWLWQHRVLSIAAGFVVVASASRPVGGFSLAAATQRGCAEDFQKFCSQKHANAAAQNTCLRQYWVSLSQECRKHLGSSKGGAGDDSGDDSE